MKYSKKEIQKKAMFLLKLKHAGDMQYIEFCTRMMLKSGQTMSFIERKIKEYALGVV